MKKRVKICCLIMAVLILTFGISAFAAATAQPPTICDVCGDPLLSAGTHIMNNTQYHDTICGQQCQINHDRSQEDRYCPNGHGVRWSGIKHVEWHYNSNCYNYPKVEYYEP